MCAPLRQARALVATASAGVEDLTGTDAVRAAALFAALARVAQAAAVRCARVAGDAGARRCAGEKSAASLLSSLSGTTVTKAKAALDVAEQIVKSPALEAAFAHGDISVDQAALIAPVAARAPEAVGTLLDAAKRSSMRELKEEAARALHQRRSEADAAFAERLVHARRYCRAWTKDGGLRIDALVGAADGAAVLAAIHREQRRLWAQASAAGYVETTDHLRADALVALLTGATPARDGGTKGPPELLVRVDAAALVRGAVSNGESCEIDGIGPVSVSTARSFLGDALWTLLVTSGADVRTVTSTTRAVPTRVRKALLLRDPRCVVPGCGASERLEIDHWGRDFSRAGPTELANLCRLCPVHHRLKTRAGWRLAGGPGRWRWLPPRSVPELAARVGRSGIRAGPAP